MLAVDGLDFEVATNTIYSLLGPNGAGKTTTLSILTTLLKPTGGSARVWGHDVVGEATAVRRRIGVTFQETVLDEALTGRQALDFHGRLYRMSKTQRKARIEELFELVELEDAGERAIKTYSGGMKRRLELARGLLTEPDVLFLDEPTLGLDPQNRSRLGEYILYLRENRGLTLLLTTHYLDEAELLSDRVGIIDDGRIVAEGTPGELIGYVGERGFVIENVSVVKPSLGDVFLRYTGRELRD